jgi:uncharacterized protein YndB with AHSA1/START domain
MSPRQSFDTVSVTSVDWSPVTEVVRSRVITADPGDVWTTLSDFGAISRWAPAVDHSCLLGAEADDAGVGAVRRVQVGRMTLLERVVDCQPPRLLAYRIEGLPPVLRSVSNEWRLDPDPGGTRATITTQVEAGPRPPQKLVAAIVARRLGAASDGMLDGLAAHHRAGTTVP